MNDCMIRNHSQEAFANFLTFIHHSFHALYMRAELRVSNCIRRIHSKLSSFIASAAGRAMACHA
jgi:hypothetical protein